MPVPGLPTIELFGPTGSAEIGTVSLHLTDRGRLDPSTPGRPRELMVQLWYPAVADDQTLAPCLSPRAAEAFGLPAECTTHAHQSAPVTRHADPLFGVIPRPWIKKSYPVVLFSHAHTSSRGFGTVLIEELASRGYIVAAVDHPYDAGAVEFPDGRVVTYQPEQERQEAPPVSQSEMNWLDEANRKALPVRVADAQFVVDSLTEMNEGTSTVAGLPDGLAGAMNLGQIGIFGHSLGGTTVAQAMLEDKRIKAGLSLDGAMPPSVRASGLDSPILFIGSEQPDPYRVIETSWQGTNQRGWHRGMRMTGTGHNSFTDLAVICTQVQCGQGMEGTLGSIHAERAVAVQRAYLVTFFDGQLKGEDAGLLNAPSSRYPEMVFLN